MENLHFALLYFQDDTLAALSTSEMSSLNWPEVKFKLPDAKKRSLDGIALCTIVSKLTWNGRWW